MHGKKSLHLIAVMWIFPAVSGYNLLPYMSSHGGSQKPLSGDMSKSLAICFFC